MLLGINCEKSDQQNKICKLIHYRHKKKIKSVNVLAKTQIYKTKLSRQRIHPIIRWSWTIKWVAGYNEKSSGLEGLVWILALDAIALLSCPNHWISVSLFSHRYNQITTPVLVSLTVMKIKCENINESNKRPDNIRNICIIIVIIKE